MKQSRPLAAEGRDASLRVLDAIAREEGTDPMEFDQRLYDAVDPEALDVLARGGATVEFTYLGYEVTVHGDGRVDVAE